MKLENKNTNHLSEFKIPKGYFNTIEDAVFEKLSEENLLQNEGYEIPDNYFDTVEDAVFEKLNLPTKKEVKVLYLRNNIFKYAAVVAFIFMIGYFFSNKKTNFNDLAVSDIENYLDENIDNLDLNSFTDNLNIDDSNWLQNYNTNEIYNELENSDIEVILFEMENEL